MYLHLDQWWIMLPEDIDNLSFIHGLKTCGFSTVQWRNWLYTSAFPRPPKKKEKNYRFAVVTIPTNSQQQPPGALFNNLQSHLSVLRQIFQLTSPKKWTNSSPVKGPI